MTCQRCNAKAQNAYLCRDCTTELGSLLLELITGPPIKGKPTAGLLEDLQDAATGRTRFTDPGPHTAPAARDYTPRTNPAASKLAASVHAQLARIAASLPVTDTIWCPPTSCVQPDFIGPLRLNQRRLPPAYQPSTLELAIWLAGHTKAIANTIAASQTFAQIHAITRRIRRAIDRPLPKQPAGYCDCGARLYASADAAEVTCSECGIVADIDTRQRQSLAGLVNEGRGFTVAEFPVVMQMLGVPYSARSFRRHRATGTLPIAGYTDAGEPLYRPADVPKFSRDIVAGITHQNVV